MKVHKRSEKNQKLIDDKIVWFDKLTNRWCRRCPSCNSSIEHTEEKIDQNGEVFTPPSLVNEMLDKLPQEVLINPEKVVGDIAGCGNGNFLIEVLNRRMKNGISHKDALKTIYGVDIDETNVNECRERLSLGKKNKEIWSILNRNIILADALNPNHKGWKEVGYMWDGKPRLDLTDFMKA